MMSQKEALALVEDTAIFATDPLEYAKTIVRVIYVDVDLKSGVCGNCCHMYTHIGTLGTRESRYTCELKSNGQHSFNEAISYQVMSVEKDFGCNKFSPKKDKH